MLLEVAGLLLGLSDHICPVATRRGHYSVAIVATAYPAFSRSIQAVTAMPNANTLETTFIWELACSCTATQAFASQDGPGMTEDDGSSFEQGNYQFGRVRISQKIEDLQARLVDLDGL